MPRPDGLTQAFRCGPRRKWDPHQGGGVVTLRQRDRSTKREN